MDGQLKRGMLDVCVLAAIRKEDSYGYQILKDLRPYVALSESTLYPSCGGWRRRRCSPCAQRNTTAVCANTIISHRRASRASSNSKPNGSRS